MFRPRQFLLGLLGVASALWTGDAAAQPSPRADHTAVWTGTHMIVWGGRNTSGVLNTGGRFNPSNGLWQATSTLNAPTPRTSHTAVWTGTELIIFGGYDPFNGIYHNDGARYNPATDTWTTLPATGAPSHRANHAAVWNGTEMVVWGGATNDINTGEVYLSTGAAYSPSANTWSPVTLSGAPFGRTGHSGVWTGTRVIVWGGVTDDLVNDPEKDNTGGRLALPGNSWSATTVNAAPTNRTEHSAIWTGTHMIIWGGLGNGSLEYLFTGGRYDPAADSWLPTNTNGAPSMRQLHTAIWTGTEMLIWGGRAASSYRGNGGRYTPGTDSWVGLPTSGAPAARANHTAVWTGTEMLVWGGETAPSVFTDTLGRYNRTADAWVVPSPPTCLLTEPASATKVLLNGSLNLAANATDPGGSITEVAFFANGLLLTTDNTAPYTAIWTNATLGNHSLTAVATDNTGLVTTSAIVVVESVLKPRLTVSTVTSNYLINLAGGQTNRAYLLQFSSNLSAWTTFSTNVATNGTFLHLDSPPTGASQRFYRAVP